MDGKVQSIGGGKRTYRPEKRQGVQAKLYLVFWRVNVSNKDQPHEKLLGAFLSAGDAEEYAAMHPGSYVFRIRAYKKKKPQIEGASNGTESTKSDPSSGL